MTAHLRTSVIKELFHHLPAYVLTLQDFPELYAFSGPKVAYNILTGAFWYCFDNIFDVLQFLRDSFVVIFNI